MQRFISAAVGVLTLGLVGVHLIYDVSHQEVRMGFLLVIVLTTATIADVYLLLRPLHPNRRLLWFIPAAYAAAAASWLIVTPMHVTDFAPLRPFIFALGTPGAIGFLFLPVLIALLPVMWPQRERIATVATVLMLMFIVLATGLAGTYYTPAALAMVLVRLFGRARIKQTAH